MSPEDRLWRQLNTQHGHCNEERYAWFLPRSTTLADSVLERLSSIPGDGQPTAAPLLLPSQSGFTEDDAAIAAANARITKARVLLGELEAQEGVGEGAGRAVLGELGALGCARILGCRMTTGTAAALALGWLPLHPLQLVSSFTAVHCAGASLTVGARALAKHVHRDQSNSWWGPPLTGSEGHKNETARAVLARLLEGASWMNVHTLPHCVMTFELRVPEGYGARWTVTDDAVAFRGFLEPPDPDGHARGWVH